MTKKKPKVKKTKSHQIDNMWYEETPKSKQQQELEKDFHRMSDKDNKKKGKKK